MQFLPRPSSKAISTTLDARLDPTLPAILEFQSPSSAIINLPMPRIARRIALTLSSMIAVMLIASGLIKVDRVVSAQGVVVAKTATTVVQPLEAAIVRSINVAPGDVVHAGQVLARLDPTFAVADMDALASQVSSLQSQVSRMQAEMDNRPFKYSGMDPNMAFQAAIYAQRQSEFNFKLENYRQKIESLQATLLRARADITTYTDRLQYAKTLEAMRMQLEHLNVGSKINTLSAMDTRAEMAGYLASAQQTAFGAQRDLAAMVAERNGYIQSWHSDIGDKLTDALSKLSDARQSLNKAQLRKQLVEFRAEQDGTVMSVSKVSVGSVLKEGDPLMTVVPTNAPLEVEANIAGRDDGHVHVGDPVDIKFETFQYSLYGMAHGIVRMISPDSFTAQDEQRNPTGSVPVSPQTSDVFYRARITLDKIQLHGVPKSFHLEPGMPVTADVRVGKQTVLHYMLGRMIPLADEAMREP